MISVMTRKQLADDLKRWLFAHDFVRPSVFIGESFDTYKIRHGFLWLKQTIVQVPRVIVTVITSLPLSFEQQYELEKFAARTRPVGISLDFSYHHEQ